MSIGEFARRSRLSPKALRLYDGLGLLPPARVDELSGYREAYVDLGPGGQIDATQWQLADEALRSWRDAQGIEDKQLSLTPEDLGVRITYLATPPITDASVPDCDFAVPFAK
jgi:MerR family regulatory protein